MCTLRNGHEVFEGTIQVFEGFRFMIVFYCEVMDESL